MPEPSFTDIKYTDPDICVSWHGIEFKACDELDNFFNKTVRPRLDDDKGNKDFRSCLNGLKLTGMGEDCLKEILSAEVPETRDWAVGESLTEAWLMESYGVQFPWNMERDKRNPFASLPGADLVGFIKEKNGFRLALGEVKTSTEKKSPPQVMSGRSGMKHQIDNLTDDMSIVWQLLRWLFFRTRNEYKQAYESSCKNFFNSQYKDVVLFGILIRDTEPNELDLSGHGKKLRTKLRPPTKCNLIALYLPYNIEELGVSLRGGGDK